MPNLNNIDSAGVYTSIDQNSTGSTTVYDPTGDGEVTGVFLENSGSTAELALEVTDGTDTARLAEPGAGNRLAFGETIRLGIGDSLQVNVLVAEGTAQTETAVAFTTE
jgi:hypothetical protein